MMRKYGLEEA
jgi:chromosome segregation ATPase